MPTYFRPKGKEIMREIKCRAWFPKTKRMTKPFILGQLIEQIENTRKEENGFYLLYTGLKDKTGKEIYKGDIISIFINIPDGYDPMQDHETSHNEELKYKVEIDEDIIRIKLIPLTENDDPFGCNDYAWYLTDDDEEHEINIIGNVHENPELLK